MNRKIKFRGKRIDNGEWVYGNLFFDFDCTDKYAPFINWKCASYLGGIGEEEIEEEAVGQYTGLDDKNGKEIYEGDIGLLDCYDYEEPLFSGEFKVIYDVEKGMWLLVDLENKDRDFTFGEIKGYYKAEIEVIGNIYENSELLGGE